MPDERDLNPAAVQNVETIVRLEEEARGKRSSIERAGDAIGSWIGTFRFVVLHLIVYAFWIVWNSGVLGWKPFDPFPFVLLTMVVSMEGVLLTTFVLMKQNYMSRRSDQRNHLNLQVDLLAEKEITKMLQMQRLLCLHFGVREGAEDREAVELSEHTAVDRLARELESKIPNE
jgi:uncharacterized membrane protein